MNKSKNPQTANQPQTTSPTDDTQMSVADTELAAIYLSINQKLLDDLEPQVKALATAIEERLAFTKSLRSASQDGITIQAMLEHLNEPYGLAHTEQDLAAIMEALLTYPQMVEDHALYLSDIRLVRKQMREKEELLEEYGLEE